MIETETICYKISCCLKLVREAVLTKDLDVASLANYLHSIRHDAQNMENGLRWRKEAMHEAGIEENYQKTRKKKLTPPGINKVANAPEQLIEDRPEYELIVKKDGEVMYQNKTYAGLLATVERFDDIDKFGTITGQSQQLYFGHPLLIFYAFNQLQQGMEVRQLEILTAFQEAMSKKKEVDPEVKKILAQMANKK